MIIGPERQLPRPVDEGQQPVQTGTELVAPITPRQAGKIQALAHLETEIDKVQRLLDESGSVSYSRKEEGKPAVEIFPITHDTLGVMRNTARNLRREYINGKPAMERAAQEALKPIEERREKIPTEKLDSIWGNWEK